MFWKLYSSIIVILFLINLVACEKDADQSNKRNALPPGMSPQASMPSDDQESEGSDPIEPSRPHFSPPARNPQATGQRSPTRINKPIVSGSSRNHVAVNPTSSRNRNPTQPMTNTPVNNNRGETQEEPLQNIDTNEDEANSPIGNNVAVPFRNNNDVPEEPIQPMNPNQADGNAPMNNNDEFPTENNVGVPQERPAPNPTRIQPNRNVPMRNSGVGRVASPQNQVPMSPNTNMVPTAGTAQNLPTSNGPFGKSSNPQGPGAFGGSTWPDFFRQPHGTTNNVAPSNVPMANSPAGGEPMVPSQTAQNTASVDQLLNKLNTLFGSNQGGNGGVGR